MKINKLLAKITFFAVLTGVSALQATPNNSYGGSGATSPGTPNGLAGASFNASAIVGSTNSLSVGNDIAWTGLVQGLLPSDTDSSTTQLTSIVSGSSTSGQTVLITGATSSDIFFGNNNYFVLHSVNNNTINYVIVSSQNAAGTAGDTIFTPNQNLVDQAVAADDTVQLSLRGRILANTKLIADTYTSTLVVKNYSGS